MKTAALRKTPVCRSTPISSSQNRSNADETSTAQVSDLVDVKYTGIVAANYATSAAEFGGSQNNAFNAEIVQSSTTNADSIIVTTTDGTPSFKFTTDKIETDATLRTIL